MAQSIMSATGMPLDTTGITLDLSVSRVRQVDTPDLATTGHMLSHDVIDVHQSLQPFNTDHILVLDDTSFSGATSEIIEKHIRRALPDRDMRFTHGFMIANEGLLGDKPGAKQRLQQLGSQVVSGMTIRTPHDDGWHLFDAVRDSQVIDTERIRLGQSLGVFVTQHTTIPDGVHARNPWLLPHIIEAGHILPEELWDSTAKQHLMVLRTLMKGVENA